MAENDNKRQKIEDAAVTRFREYLRVNTMQPNPDYAGCTAFLKKISDAAGLDFQTWEAVPGKPVVLMTWVGTQPDAPSILLNSHTDVVPVFPEHWKYPPFSAEKDDEGNIYARGSQDMKCVGMQYYESILRMKKAGKRFPRTFHLCWVPDEEIGGHDGMKVFVKDPVFKSLNVGFALDEGLASPTDVFRVFYGERVPWWVRVKVTGQPGHGSQFIENNVGRKLQTVINKFLGLRNEQELKLKAENLELGDVTTVNLTMLDGGVQFNVIPAEMSVGFDIRLPPTVDLQEFHDTVKEFTAEEGVSFTFESVNWENPITPVDDSNIFWQAFKEGCKESDIKIKEEIFPAATDSRYIRCAGLPAIGFSPMINTPVLLHDHNEYLNEDIFLRGIDIYDNILARIASVPV